MNDYLSTDVAYKDGKGYGIGVIFNSIDDDTPSDIIKVIVEEVGEYTPGEFYKRELKVLLAIYEEYKRRCDRHPLITFIDAYVDLGDKNGCGQYFADAIKDKTIVIGIAKNAYKPADSVTEKVLRGLSTKPLYVTSTIISRKEAGVLVKLLHGTYRHPTIIKETDMLTKDFVKHITGE